MVRLRLPRVWMWMGPLLIVAATLFELVAVDGPVSAAALPVLLVLLHAVLVVVASTVPRRGFARIALGAIMLSAVAFGLFAGFVWLPMTALLVMLGCILALAMVGMERRSLPGPAGAAPNR